MTIIETFPQEPLWGKIKEAGFNFTDMKPVFTVGDTLYNPHKCYIADHLMTHEEVHSERQKEMGVKKWWNEYLSNPKFRVDEEVLAFKAQYKFAQEFIKDRNALSRFLVELANTLSSPMYGNVLTRVEAMNLIR